MQKSTEFERENEDRFGYIRSTCKLVTDPTGSSHGFLGDIKYYFGEQQESTRADPAVCVLCSPGGHLQFKPRCHPSCPGVSSQLSERDPPLQNGAGKSQEAPFPGLTMQVRVAWPSRT